MYMTESTFSRAEVLMILYEDKMGAEGTIQQRQGI